MHPDKIESFYGHMKILLPEHRRIQRIDIKRLFLLNLHPWVNLFKGRGNGKEREGKEKEEREGIRKEEGERKVLGPLLEKMSFEKIPEEILENWGTHPVI